MYLKKKLINQRTVKNWKGSSARILSILDASEEKNLSTLDIEDVCTRFANLAHQKITPESLMTYRGRLKTAIKEFLAYKKDLMHYRPSIESRRRRKNRDTKSQNISNTPAPAQRYAPDSLNKPHEEFTCQIPLRSGQIMVAINHLPVDLTDQEAEKIGTVIKSLSDAQ